jgi:hypothetical protein
MHSRAATPGGYEPASGGRCGPPDLPPGVRALRDAKRLEALQDTFGAIPRARARATTNERGQLATPADPGTEGGWGGRRGGSGERSPDAGRTGRAERRAARKQAVESGLIDADTGEATLIALAALSDQGRTDLDAATDRARGDALDALKGRDDRSDDEVAP